MERKYFKALNFDLDTHQLKEHYPGANYRQAYDDLRRFFKRHQFSHRQGSGYISDTKLSTADIYDLMDELVQKLPWIISFSNGGAGCSHYLFILLRVRLTRSRIERI